jgi:hypothetical protein
MPTIRFSGHIVPMRPPHEIGSLKPITWEYLDTKETESYEISFDGTKVTVDIVLNFEPRIDMISQHRNKALELATNALNIVCFVEGMGLTLYLDRCVWPDGTEEIPLPGDDRLKSLVSITNIDISRMSAMLAEDQQLSRIFNDLIFSITWPYAAAINCARAIEGIRRHNNPAEGKDDRAASWGILQDALNISRAYREFIIQVSIPPRHGDSSFIPSEKQEDVIVRAWTIMDRYLQYLARGKKPLAELGFSLL